MKNPIIPVVTLSLLTLPVSSLAEPPKEVAYASEKPAYAKVALTQDASKVVTVVFHESQGTGKGYDVLYADVNFNGRFEKSERLEADRSWTKGFLHVFCKFPPIKIKVPSNQKASNGLCNPCELAFCYRKHVITLEVGGKSREVTLHDFAVTAKMAVAQGSTEWVYSFSGHTERSDKMENAPVWGLVATPTLTINAKPDVEKKEELGIDLGLVSEKSKLEQFECTREGIPVKARVQIKNRGGRVIHRADETLDKFRFG